MPGPYNLVTISSIYLAEFWQHSASFNFHLCRCSGTFVKQAKVNEEIVLRTPGLKMSRARNKLFTMVHEIFHIMIILKKRRDLVQVHLTMNKCLFMHKEL